MAGPGDFFVSCGASIARDLVWGAIREASYCCCFDNFVKDLKDEKDELLNYKERVNNHAKGEELKKAKKIDDEDKDWLERADTLVEQVKKLEAKVEKYQNCCLGHFPNCIFRYLVGRQLVEQKDKVRRHCEKRPRYRELDRLVTLQGMGYFSSEYFIEFNSRKPARMQLMRAIEDDGVSMIGLCGMAGCGKTTLAKEVGKEAEERFNYKVVFVVVSGKVEVRRIQDKIASAIEFELDKKEELERAKRLSTRLRRDDERFLIILDDVWEILNFEAIGIPFGENRKGCKVLVTTRRSYVCSGMDCQEIRLSLLSSRESWTLFQKYAHFTNETSDILKDLAEKIMEKCAGLPVAIAAVASTLKGKSEVEWAVALNKLKKSKRLNIEEGLQNPYKLLELSYQNVKCQQAKSLFVLCAAFPKDMNIDVEILTRFAIGLGLFEEVGSYTMARQQVIVAKNELVNVCLLLEAEDGKDNSIKMHDLLRDVALYLAEKKIKVIKGDNNNENASEEHSSILKDNQVRYLLCEKFPNQLSCAKLEFLFVYNDSEIVEKPSRVFEQLKKLQVLALVAAVYIGERLQLPKSIHKLTNLRCLYLMNYQLGHMSFLRSMKGLESLTLIRCTFHEFPDAIVHLTKLKLLAVTRCEIQKNPYEVIRRCSQLEELYFYENDCSEWNFDDKTAAEFLEKFSAPQEIKRYHIGIGAREEGCDITDDAMLNILTIEYFDASISNAIIKDWAKRANVLSLGHIKGCCKSIAPDFYQKVGVMSELVELMLHNSEEIKYLIDTTGKCEIGILLSKLSKVWIRQMHNLEALCHGPPSLGLFEKLEKVFICDCSKLHDVLFGGKLNLSNLKVLEVRDCPELTSLFTPDCAQSLLQLQNLEIYRCGKLEHIITQEMRDEIIEDDDDDRRINQSPFKKLKVLSVCSCKQLKYIVPVFYARGLEGLESMIVEEVDELKFLFGQFDHANQLANPTKIEFEIILPDLKLLKLVALPNIVSILPENYYTVWPSLHELNVNNCPQFAIVSPNECVAGSKVRQHCNPTKGMDPFITPSNHNSDGISYFQTLLNSEKLDVTKINVRSIFRVAGFSLNVELALPLGMSLKSLFLRDLHELSYICKGPVQIMSLQNLLQLDIHGCGKIKSVFLTNSFESMPQLQELSITGCNQLVQIVASEESCPNGASNCCSLYSGSLNLCSLKRLKIYNCPMLRSLFTLSTAETLTSLENLELSGCHGLKEIINYKNFCGGEKKETKWFPKLKDLKIQKCNSLECLFPPVSFIQELKKLKRVWIEEAAGLQYLFSEGSHEYQSSGHKAEGEKRESSGHKAEGEKKESSDHKAEGEKKESSGCQNQKFIDLPLLEFLNLMNLPNLISICPNHFYATFGSLQTLSLLRVGLSNPTTGNLKGGSEDKQWYYSSVKDLGVTTLKLVQNFGSVTAENSIAKSDFSEKDSLLISNKVTSRVEMGFLCISRYCFLNLQRIEVNGRGKLRALFSVSVLISLHQLKELIITECEELEQITTEDEDEENETECEESEQTSTEDEENETECEESEQTTTEDEENQNMSNPYCQKVCFPRLRILCIKHCNKLKRLFSISTSRELPNLECLLIKEASQLEEFFESEKCEIEESKEVVLPELKCLILVQLPSLTGVWQGIELQTVTCRVVQNCPNLSLTTALQKSVEELVKEIGEPHEFVSSELKDILCTTTEETLNEGTVVESKVSDSASGNEPSSSQIIKEKGKEIVENGSASRIPAIAMSSTNVHDSMNEQSISEPTLLHQLLALEETKLTTEVPQEISISSDQSVEALVQESAKESPTSKEAVIATLSDDIASPIGPLPKVSAKELMNIGTETIMTKQQDFGELTSHIHSSASHNSVAKEVQENLPIKKANTVTSLHKSSARVIVERYSTSKPHSMEQQTIGDKKVTNDAPNIPSDPAKHVTEPENNNAPKVASEEIAVETSPKLKSLPLYQSDSSLNKIFSQGVVDGVHESLAMENAKVVSSTSQNIDAIVKESAQEGPSFEEARIATFSSDLALGNSPPAGSLVIGLLQHLGAIDSVQEGLPMEKAKPVTTYSQEHAQVVPDADNPGKVLATHVEVEVVNPVPDQPQQIGSPLPTLSAGSAPPHTVSSYQPESITMSLSSGQTSEELVHFSQPELTLPAPGSINSFELYPLDELELLLTDSSFSTSTDVGPLQSHTKKLSIRKMAEDLDDLFDKVVDELYDDPAIVERLAQISSISESMTESEAPSTFVDFMKKFRTMYPQLLKDFEKSKTAVLEYEKAKTEKDNMAAEIPKIKGKNKELEDNIRRAESADKFFSDEIGKLKRQLAEVESRGQAQKVVLSSLHHDRTKMDLNTQALLEKAKKITQFINSNSSAYAENRANLTSLRNVWIDLKSQFVQSCRDLKFTFVMLATRMVPAGSRENFIVNNFNLKFELYSYYDFNLIVIMHT